ncbi:globin family protein [Roseibium sp. RKSG952]|uniref:globin family protein n=1 Tax=Roseibium sp. RKSG952 TaxID=2529384 RepID=UPI0012BCABB9|nr:globin family protein [Roseibium sp. RKSG952]MTH99834.1 hemin receptor [Roseibium sp. RKSG952]
MTPDQIQLVQSSFAKVKPIADDAASLFYGRLFEIAPEVKPFFKTDLRDQGRKLMATLGVVVNGLSDPETILPAARNLAVRHIDYGVRREHYAPVGAALLWTLEKGLGEAFDPETKSAWEEAYATIAGVMIEAAYPKLEAAE